MPRVGFEPTIPVLEQEKTVHVLDRAATVIKKFVVKEIKFTLFKRLTFLGTA
jgi:hypothetical protein